MSDEYAKSVEKESVPSQLPTGQSVSVSVTLHPNGRLEFSLPLGNKILCYGLIGAAKAEADKQYLLHELKQQSVARGGINGLLKRVNGG